MGVSKSERFTGAGAFIFNVPVGVTSVFVSLTGGGGGGGGCIPSVSSSGFGGGAAEFILKMPMVVVSGGTVTGVIGAGGVGAQGSALNPTNVGNDGESTTCGSYTVLGGRLGSGNTNGTGMGGGIGAHDPGRSQNTNIPGWPGLYSPSHGTTGGAGAGAGGSSGHGAPSTDNSMGGPAINAGYTPAGPDVTLYTAGSSGGSTPWGVGGVGGAYQTIGNDAPAPSYGAGGGGGGASTTIGVGGGPYVWGGNGTDGMVEFIWSA